VVVITVSLTTAIHGRNRGGRGDGEEAEEVEGKIHSTSLALVNTTTKLFFTCLLPTMCDGCHSFWNCNGEDRKRISILFHFGFPWICMVLDLA
jgi:hypothetical protein